MGIGSAVGRRSTHPHAGKFDADKSRQIGHHLGQLRSYAKALQAHPQCGHDTKEQCGKIPAYRRPLAKLVGGKSHEPGSGGHVIDKERISSGGITQTAVDVRLILRAAILRQATQIAIVHNHPSGNLRPSVEDLHLTQRVKQACEAVNIRLIDHLIIVDGGFYSFNDHDEL